MALLEPILGISAGLEELLVLSSESGEQEGFD